MDLGCLARVQSQDGPWEEMVYESVALALNAPAPSARGQQAEQLVTRKELVFEDPLCPGETAAVKSLFLSWQWTVCPVS